jgi:hypothetical protein
MSHVQNEMFSHALICRSAYTHTQPLHHMLTRYTLQQVYELVGHAFHRSKDVIIAKLDAIAYPVGTQQYNRTHLELH